VCSSPLTMAMNFVTFNQDYSCLAVGKLELLVLKTSYTADLKTSGTSKGFRIYHTDPFAKIFSSDDGNVAIIEMLFSTSLVALILSPRHLVIQNTKVLYTHHWSTFQLTRLSAFFHYLRAYIPICGPGCAAQPQATCRCAWGGNISVRHLEHDPSLYYCHLIKSQCYLRFGSIFRQMLYCISAAENTRRYRR
jgi:hypothetical protein